MRLGDQRGIALVAVLWVVTILALVAAVFMRETRTEIALTRNLAAEAKAEALAEAGVNRAILILLGLDDTIPWRVDGTAIAFSYGGGMVQLSLQDEGGKIDLNRAGDTVLQGLFTSVGVGQDAAEHFHQRNREHQSGRQSNADLPHGLSEDCPHHATAGGAHRQADADFARALVYRKRD